MCGCRVIKGVNQRRTALCKPSLFIHLSVLFQDISQLLLPELHKLLTLFAGEVKFWYQLYCHLLFPYACIRTAS